MPTITNEKRPSAPDILNIPLLLAAQKYINEFPDHFAITLIIF
jgi:hypothetical protein